MHPPQLPLRNSFFVFEGPGALPGKYQIVIDENIPACVHALRRVPVALRQPIEEKLDDLVEHEVLVPVTEPTGIQHAGHSEAEQGTDLYRSQRPQLCRTPRTLPASHH